MKLFDKNKTKKKLKIYVIKDVVIVHRGVR